MRTMRKNGACSVHRRRQASMARSLSSWRHHPGRLRLVSLRAFAERQAETSDE